MKIKKEELLLLIGDLAFSRASVESKNIKKLEIDGDGVWVLTPAFQIVYDKWYDYYFNAFNDNLKIIN